MAGQNLAGPPPKPPSASPHELGYGLAASPVSAALGTPSPRPEMMLGLWTSWVEYVSKLASDMGAAPGSSLGQTSQQMSPDQFTGGLQQFEEMVAKESILDSILDASDDALNANPLRQIIPVDWAEIARALRTVWLRSVSQPERALAAVADFNIRQGQSWIDTWDEAWRRWCGLARPEPAALGGADKRFAAPEWQGNPVYHTLKELYLIASRWRADHNSILKILE